MTLRLPSLLSVLAVLLALGGAFLAAGVVVRGCARPEPSGAARDSSLAALRDSVLRARVEDSVELVARVDSILRLRGDSLASAFARKAAALRPRIIRIPGAVDTVRDTIETDDSGRVAGADMRAVLIGLEACEVDRDAYRGELVVCQASDSAKAQELRERPTSCHGWSAFGWGYAAGVVTTATACVVGD